MIATTITIDQLLRVIESIVFNRPISMEELRAHLKLTVCNSSEPDVLQLVLAALKDKYSCYLYGIGFSWGGGLLQFQSQGVQEILKH